MFHFSCRFAFFITFRLSNQTPKIAPILTLYQANAATLTPLSKEDKILIKNLQESKRLQRSAVYKTKVGRRTASTGCWWSSEQLTGVWAAADGRSAHTDENVDTVESLLLSQEDKPQSQEKFHVRRGIHRSSVSQIIHKVLRLKCYKKSRTQQLTEAHSMNALFSVCSLRDNNAITSKPTWKPKHANSILKPSEYFYQISSKSIHPISSYTVAKLGRFCDTV